MAHAILSPSGAEKWLNCTPSARLEENFPNTTSEYAAEGTLAHKYAELVVQYNIKRLTKKAFQKAFSEVKKDKLYSTEMDDYVDAFARYVDERYQEARKRSKDAVILSEHRLDLRQYVPEGFGTGDVVIIADGHMDIIDLKYGKGVQVSAEENKQMMLYALGALAEFDILYGVDRIRMVIHQPRLDNISEWEISAEELYRWAEAELKPKAEVAFAGTGEFLPGDHCRFCRAKATCRARAEENLAMAKFEFQDPPLLSDDEIGEIIMQAERLKKWAEDVHDYAYDQAVNHGKKWPGLKLVEGRSNRVYKDDAVVADKLTEHGFKEDEVYNKKIIGITAMEKLLGKVRFGTLLDGLVIKPAGKPALVPESDKRLEINSNASAEEDFKDDLIGGIA